MRKLGKHARHTGDSKRDLGTCDLAPERTKSCALNPQPPMQPPWARGPRQRHPSPVLCARAETA